MVDLPPSIAAYAPQAEAILEWAADWIDQDAFDERAQSWSPTENDGKTRPIWYDGRSILLPSVWQHNGQGEDFIAIAQELMRAKLLCARKRHGRVEYRTAPDA